MPRYVHSVRYVSSLSLSPLHRESRTENLNKSIQIPSYYIHYCLLMYTRQPALYMYDTIQSVAS